LFVKDHYYLEMGQVEPTPERRLKMKSQILEITMMITRIPA